MADQDDNRWADGYELSEVPADLSYSRFSLQGTFRACENDLHAQTIACYMKAEWWRVRGELKSYQALLDCVPGWVKQLKVKPPEGMTPKEAVRWHADRMIREFA